MSNLSKKANRKKRYYRAKGRGLSKKQKLQIQKMITEPQEKKFYDVTFDAQNVSLTPTIIDLTAPANGTGSDQIIGSSFNLISLQFRLIFTKSDTTNYIRFVIFQWHPDGATDPPSWNQIFQYETAGVPVSLQQVVSPYVLGEGGTSVFKVLIDEQFYLDSDNPIQIFNGFINKGFRKTLEANDSAQQGTEHIYIMYVSDSGAIGHPVMTGYTRARFTDA